MLNVQTEVWIKKSNIFETSSKRTKRVRNRHEIESQTDVKSSLKRTSCSPDAPPPEFSNFPPPQLRGLQTAESRRPPRTPPQRRRPQKLFINSLVLVSFVFNQAFKVKSRRVRRSANQRLSSFRVSKNCKN